MSPLAQPMWTLSHMSPPCFYPTCLQSPAPQYPLDIFQPSFSLQSAELTIYLILALVTLISMVKLAIIDLLCLARASTQIGGRTLCHHLRPLQSMEFPWEVPSPWCEPISYGSWVAFLLLPLTNHRTCPLFSLSRVLIRAQVGSQGLLSRKSHIFIGWISPCCWRPPLDFQAHPLSHPSPPRMCSAIFRDWVVMDPFSRLFYPFLTSLRVGISSYSGNYALGICLGVHFCLWICRHQES